MYKSPLRGGLLKIESEYPAAFRPRILMIQIHFCPIQLKDHKALICQEVKCWLRQKLVGR